MQNGRRRPSCFFEQALPARRTGPIPATACSPTERVRQDARAHPFSKVLQNSGRAYSIGGRSALDIARRVCGNAAAVVAVGSCAFDGGPQRADPNPTGAISVGEAIPNLNLVNMGGCPHNPANTAALLVYWLTYGRMPALDAHKRPLFAYGHIIHDQCERRANFDAGRFVESWDDDGARRGYCLYKMGCKGPQGTFNCPVVRWNDGTSWPVESGHGSRRLRRQDTFDRRNRREHNKNFFLPKTGPCAIVLSVSRDCGAGETHV